MWYDNENSMGIMKKKYLHEGEKPEDLIPRICSIFSDEVKPKAEKVLNNADFLPAGRTITGAGYKGTRKVSMSNCYILPNPEDNIESIFDTAKRIARISSYGGGTGLCIDNLRPKGSKVNNSAITSTGAVSFLPLFNTTGEVIGQHGRRAALMVALRCDHPDIEEFLNIKKNNVKLSAMNISIKFTDEFMRAVINNENVKLHFDSKQTGHIEKIINARKFFDDFCKTQWDMGDPGALFIDRINGYNLLDGYPEYHVDVTNPCVSGDTLLLTRELGYYPIEKLVGVPVNIWNGYQWSQVVPKVTGHNQKMLRVHFSNGMSLDCTYYHKFVLNGGKRVKAQDLHIGDKLERFNYPIMQGGMEFIHHDAYTNGFYAGDGTTSRNVIEIYGDKEQCIPYMNIDHTTYQSSNNRTHVVLNESPLPKDMVPLEFFFTLKYKLEWLAGLIDSDGTKNSKEGSINISSINLNFLKKVQLMLSTMGVTSNVALMKAGGMRMMPANDGTGAYKPYMCQDCYRLVISGSNVAILLALGLSLHRVEVNPRMDKLFNNRFIRVTSIEMIPDAETVYCVTEPFNHTAVFNGIMTGQCAEFGGCAYNSCNLGSINLYNMIDNKFTPEAKVNFDKLIESTKTGIDMLDEILDYGYDMQPLDENRTCIDNWRSIGLGVFGLADAFVAMRLRYGSANSIKITKQIMGTIINAALEESSRLAVEKGTFKKYDKAKTNQSNFLKSVEKELKNIGIKPTGVYAAYENGLRNGTLISVAPTGTISIFAGDYTGGVEPMFKIAYKRTSHSTENEHKTFTIYSRGIRDLLKYHNIDGDKITADEIKEKFPFAVESYDIDPMNRVSIQAAMQPFVDSSISSTINLPHSATVEDVFKIYIKAWESHLKGITTFRDGCARGNILGVDFSNKKVVTPSYNSILPAKRRGVAKVDGSTYKQSSSCAKSMYVTVNKTSGGDIFEVFTNTSGGCQANISTITRLVSLALRSGIKVDKIVEELRENKCPACQALRRGGNKDVSLSCANAIADAVQKAIDNTNEVEDVKEEEGFLVCPSCHKRTLRPEGKCFTCSNCGYNACDN